ncbi:hypothetical protein BC6307_02485 [Sutcliffiella cohnii]|uniref:histidine kinase n=1 Tax=Sutcliffiella cohnii TaxID=33932 RepID=A0A223KLI6_9BACI|nr:sensor histidine kinase [Sutcliffiella cohnii]AST90228.1 hypothetical protein BC6307_02485 [Sutcliffiella cohnii]
MSNLLFEYMKDYLVNMLFIILPILFSQSIISKEHTAFETNKQKFVLAIIFSGTSILCMSFPFELGDTILDLRLIPFVIGMLYGGVRVGLTIIFSSLTFRFFLGGIGFYLSVVEYVIIFILIYFVLKNYRSLSLWNKIITVSIVTVIPTLILLPYACYIIGSSVVVKVAILLSIISFFSLWCSIYLMESTIEKVHMIIQLHKFEKETIVSHLAASVSHEVRNPLTVTKGFLQLLKEKYKDTDDRYYFELALEELQTAESIISDYLTYAKPSMENQEPLNLFEEMQRSINVIKSYAQMHNVDINVAGEDISYKGDKEKIRQLFINIFKNCIEAMPEGGTLTASMFCNQQIEITIKDTGIGMTESQLLRIGEPFFSTKENGTGLGMMVAFSVVKSMGGTYKVLSKEAEGTSFHISLPLTSKKQRKTGLS